MPRAQGGVRTGPTGPRKPLPLPRARGALVPRVTAAVILARREDYDIADKSEVRAGRDRTFHAQDGAALVEEDESRQCRHLFLFATLFRRILHLLFQVRV